jgi:hypothetical protein
LQLVADLVGQSWQRRIVEILGQSHAFIAAIRLDVGGLATEINIVFGVDLKLLGDLGRQLAKARPDPRHIADADIRIRQHLERRAALAVFAQGEAVPRGFTWRDDKLPRHGARSIEPCHLGAMRPRPYRADAAERNTPIRQTLIGIVGAQRQPIFGPRGEHPIGLSDTAGDEIVDHDPEVAFGAVEHDWCTHACPRGRVETGHKALRGSLLVARGAVDLAGQEKPR